MSEISAQELIDFIARSPSTFHISQNLAEMLEQAGFEVLSEGDLWQLQPGHSYYVRRSLTSLIAFRIPMELPRGFQMAAAHLDSPTFRIKGKMEMVDRHYTRLNVEKYGSMLLPPWFDRPLSVAGKVIVEEEGKLVSRLVNVDRDLLVIPHLAIHMRREANSGENLSVQKDMAPLYGDQEAEGSFLNTVAATIGKTAEDILGFDLFLYLRTHGTIWGAKGEFFSAPRLDDLECAYSLIKSIIAAPGNSLAIPLCAIYDNEEVGSTTKDGAASPFLQNTLERIAASLGLNVLQLQAMMASSFMVSADNAHAKHPNHPEKADPTTYPVMNAGMVIKVHGGQKYATDSTGAAVFRTICRRAGTPVQLFNNHSDMRSGSTLGNISTHHVAVNTADVGLAQLSMHSPYETAGTRDLAYMMDTMVTYFNSHVHMVQPGVYEVVTEG